MAEEKTFELYTDGACNGNPGPGGWAVILSANGHAVWYAGHEERTTNNRMEILATIKGLEHTPPDSEVTIYSDSQYLVNTMSKHWQRKVNHDLWGRLDALVKGRRVNWEWIRGHAGHPLNEEANRLAQAAATQPDGGERSSVLGAEATQKEALPPPTEAPYPSPHLSHLDEQGRALMVDVSAKGETQREAIAKGAVYMQPETLALIQSGGIAKGDVFTVAKIAGIMAAKKTSDLIPMCHPLPLTHVAVEFRADEARARLPDLPTEKAGLPTGQAGGQACVEITATVRTTGVTGVEMEALTAVSVAALTIYDMCKAADRAMRIGDIRLTRKSGGKSGLFQQD